MGEPQQESFGQMAAAERAAGEAVVLAARDPGQSYARATAVLARTSHPRVASVALRALGLALHEEGDSAAALARLGEAALVAESANLPRRAHQAHLSRLGILAQTGDAQAAATEAAELRPPARADAPRLLVHRGVALARLERFDDALSEFDAAIADLRCGDDPRFLAGALNNRGLLRVEMAEWGAARADLNRALYIAHRFALDYMAALARQNLGCLAARRRETSRAVALFDRAAPWLVRHRARDLTTDRAEALRDTAKNRPAERVEADVLNAEPTASTGNASEALERLERLRTPVAQLANSAPPNRALERLRDVTSQWDEAYLLDDEARLGLRSEQARLEAYAHGRRRRSQAAGSVATRARPALAPARLVDHLAAELVGDAFVSYARVQDLLIAITVVDGHCRLHELGPLAPVRDAAAKLRFTARRRVLPGGADAATASRCAQQLDTMLLRPLDAVLGERSVVLSLTDCLQGTPWGTLPRLRGRAVTIAPSALTWLRGRRNTAADPTAGRVLLAAGPRLTHAETEVARLAAGYSGARVLTGERANAAALRSELAQVELAHIAAHGYFRSAAPMLSGIVTATGPLMGYDLTELKGVPRRVVLSTCNGGQVTASGGDQAPGFAATLLALGSLTVIASVLPVRDEDVVDPMVELHRRLAAGHSPAAAVADTVAAAGFVCFGSG